MQRIMYVISLLVLLSLNCVQISNAMDDQLDQQSGVKEASIVERKDRLEIAKYKQKQKATERDQAEERATDAKAADLASMADIIKYGGIPCVNYTFIERFNLRTNWLTSQILGLNRAPCSDRLLRVCKQRPIALSAGRAANTSAYLAGISVEIIEILQSPSLGAAQKLALEAKEAADKANIAAALTDPKIEKYHDHIVEDSRDRVFGIDERTSAAVREAELARIAEGAAHFLAEKAIEFEKDQLQSSKS